MNLEEYKIWLKEHANKEEEKAYEIAKEIIEYHRREHDEINVELFPRKIITTKKERLEFDLIIRIEFLSRRKTSRTIGVEFKEYDIRNVIQQAITRRQYVNYQYIATKFVTVTYSELFLMAYYGLGWVVWDDDFVKILIPAKQNYPAYDLDTIIYQIVKDAVRDKVKEEMETLTKFIFD